MSYLKKEKDLILLREAGKRLGSYLRILSALVTVGATGKMLDAKARDLIEGAGDIPSFLNYQPAGARKPFPATLCVSINDAIVHGVPTDKPFVEGDLVSLDLGLIHKGVFVDAAVTVPVGHVSEDARLLMERTKESLDRGISAAIGGGRIGDIGHAVESHARQFGYGVVEELAGHGVGHAVHEPPFIPNFGAKGSGEPLLPGMVIAIEPMLTSGGSHEIVLGDDQFTYKTKDGTLSAHFEHTLIITEGAPEIITALH